MEENKRRPGKIHKGFLTQLGNLARDRRGVGAVEFALIAPILLSLYITSFEITVGLSISKRLTRSASTIADLVTRETTVSKSTLGAMDAVADSLFFPFVPDNKVIKVTGIAIDANNNPTVGWSWSSNGVVPYAKGASVTVPKDMLMPSSFLVRAEITIDHELLMFMSAPEGNGYKKITMGREFYYRQRVGTDIPCSDCNS